MLHAIDWDGLPWTRVREGVERKAFSSTSATIALHRLQPGHQPSPHSHVNEQIVYIVAGTVDFHVGNEIVRLGPGGLIVVPPNVDHHAIVVGAEPVLNFDVFTPARPEYAALPSLQRTE